MPSAARKTTPNEQVLALLPPRWQREGDYTFEDFCALVPDGTKADLLDGVIYVASPDNTDASDLQTWLSSLLHLFVEAKDLGRIYVSRSPTASPTSAVRSRTSV